ncbi:MAG TPA: LysE family transporter [Gaiellaceae bacterium]|nr:LysE family transporter [Gaiellaceae bacterium]
MAGALAAGLGLGFVTAAQVGPIWLLCLRSTLRGGFRVGVAIGAGAAVIDMVYAALGVAGASRLLEIDPLRVALGVAGAAVLALLGLRTLWSAFRIRLGGETAEEVGSPRRAFVTSLGATASNPMTIAAWAAIFTAASTASVVESSRAAVVVLVGAVCVGSFVWFVLLSAGTAIGRRYVGERLVAAIDAVSGLAIVGFAGVLGWRTVQT